MATYVWLATIAIDLTLISRIPHWIEDQVRDHHSKEVAKAWKAGHERDRAKTLDDLTAFSNRLPQLFQKSELVVTEGHMAVQFRTPIRQAVP